MVESANKMPPWLKLKLQRVGAEDLLRRYEVRAPPVDPKAIAEAMGITVKAVADLLSSGTVDSNEESATITVNASEVPWRQRFTIAHELGHLMMHPLGVLFRDTSFAGDGRERQANTFAADLLMPLWMVEPYALKYGANSAKIASIFGVSERAMNIRLANLVGRNG